MPAGIEVTVPVPAPVLDTDSVCWCSAKEAVTDRAASMVTTQLPVPLHPAPDHPEKSESAAGVADRVTTSPSR